LGLGQDANNKHDAGGGVAVAAARRHHRPITRNVTSSTIPEVHNVSDENWVTATDSMHKILVNFTDAITNTCSQTDRQTHRHTHTRSSYNAPFPYGGEVIHNNDTRHDEK